MPFWYFSGAQEYCNMEEFSAQCPADSVILMNFATYGRVRLGKCIKENYGNIGCHIDVLNRMDELCSGRRDCQFTVPDLEMYNRRSCPVEFNSHLEAGYSCIKGTFWMGLLSVNARYLPYEWEFCCVFISPQMEEMWLKWCVRCSQFVNMFWMVADDRTR